METPSPPPAPIDCPSCGERIEREYCPGCGERRPRPDDLALRTFVLQAFEGLTNLDGKTWRSILGLARPGWLTAEYILGARTRYLRPMALFLLANVAYFLLQPWTGARTFNTSLEIHRARLAHSRLATAWVDEQLARTGESLADYTQRFDAASDTLSRTLILVLAPGIAAGLALLNRKRRLGEHFTFALHLLAAFQLYVALAFTLTLSAVVHLAARCGLDLSMLRTEEAMTTTIVVALTVYSALGQRRVSGGGTPRAVLKGLALTAIFALQVQLYRALLFFVVFWTI